MTRRNTSQQRAIRSTFESAGCPLSIHEFNELAEAAARHHHHFHCLGCDRVYDVQGCPGRMDRMVPDGFVLDGHEITLNGWCAECA